MEVLLVEDNEGDILLIRQALKGIGSRFNLHVAMDGEVASAFIYRKAPKPDLIILDINIPKKDGHQLLRELKAEADLKEIPVVIFSSSGSRHDVELAYQLHANSYVRKPTDIDEFFHVVAGIEQFWTATALLPPT